jgi:hypothetical protein
LELVTKLNFKRRQNGKDINDNIELTLAATKDELKLTIPTSKIKDCNTTDLIYCLSAGYLDVPQNLGIPMFPKVVVTLNWNKKPATASIDGRLSKDGEHWELNESFGSILRMENPRLEADIGFGKGSRTGSVKGEAV